MVTPEPTDFPYDDADTFDKVNCTEKYLKYVFDDGEMVIQVLTPFFLCGRYVTTTIH